MMIFQPLTIVSIFFLVCLPPSNIATSPHVCHAGDNSEDCGGDEEEIRMSFDDDDDVHAEGGENKYSAEANDVAVSLAVSDYSRLIEEANAKFAPCKGCDCYNDFLEADLAPFDTISNSTLNRIRETVRHVVTYQIIKGRVYRSKECLFPIRCQGIEHFLLNFAKEDDVADTEITVNTHDWPYMNRYFEETPLPLLSFSKNKDYHDISYPAWSFWAGGPATDLYPKGLGRWDQFRDSLSKSALAHPWSRKVNKAFFRGSRTSTERDNVVLLSRIDPDLIDAEYTKNQAWKSEKDTLDAKPAKEVSLEDHCRYRYLFNFRGVAASFRFRHLFLCGSLVVHVGAEWLEFFYPAMKPWVHYVPLKADASQEEIRALLEFLRGSPDLSERIAERGKQFVHDNLRMEDVMCYWRRLLEGYTKRLNFRPVRNNAFMEIK